MRRILTAAVAFMLGSAVCQTLAAQQEPVTGRATVSATVVASGATVDSQGELKGDAAPVRFCAAGERTAGARKIDSCFAVAEAGEKAAPRQLVSYDVRGDGPSKVLVLTY